MQFLRLQTLRENLLIFMQFGQTFHFIKLFSGRFALLCSICWPVIFFKIIIKIFKYLSFLEHFYKFSIKNFHRNYFNACLGGGHDNAVLDNLTFLRIPY